MGQRLLHNKVCTGEKYSKASSINEGMVNLIVLTIINFDQPVYYGMNVTLALE